MSYFCPNAEGVKKMKKYQVIGGQYKFIWYGESDSLQGAKRIATKNEEYWDNWKGWHKPKIYTREQCSKNKIPKPEEKEWPVAEWDSNLKKWITH